MKCVWILLVVTVCYVEGKASPEYSYLPSSYDDKGYVLGSWGRDGNRGYSGVYGGSGSRDGNRGYSGVYGGQELIHNDYYEDPFPRVIGRQGLGYEKRQYYSLAMRWPITPEILQPIGYRKTLDELKFVPLDGNRY